MPRWRNVVALVLALVLAVPALSFAQDQKTPGGSSIILIPGALSRLESYGAMGYWRLCSPQSIGLNEWQASFVERLIQPTNSQIELLRNLQTASATAKSTVASACVKETVSTGPIHFAEMQKRLNALGDSIRILRGPYEALYASLDSHQKALLDGLGPSRRGWAW